MSKGIFIALSGAVLKEKQMELIAQNLANSNASAYKKLQIAFKDHLVHPDGVEDGRTMADVAAVTTDFSPGGIHATGNPLDLALEGEGFLALEKNRFTRRGDLLRNAEGYLTTRSGIPVLGNNGPVWLPEGRVEIGPRGEITVNQVPIDTLQIVEIPEPKAMVRLGEDLYQTDQPTRPSSARVKQGYLEGSNVEVVREMTRIILTLREFQAFQKIIQGFEEAAAKMNEVAKI